MESSLLKNHLQKYWFILVNDKKTLSNITNLFYESPEMINEYEFCQHISIFIHQKVTINNIISNKIELYY